MLRTQYTEHRTAVSSPELPSHHFAGGPWRTRFGASAVSTSLFKSRARRPRLLSLLQLTTNPSPPQKSPPLPLLPFLPACPLSVTLRPLIRASAAGTRLSTAPSRARVVLGSVVEAAASLAGGRQRALSARERARERRRVTAKIQLLPTNAASTTIRQPLQEARGQGYQSAQGSKAAPSPTRQRTTSVCVCRGSRRSAVRVPTGPSDASTVTFPLSAAIIAHVSRSGRYWGKPATSLPFFCARRDSASTSLPYSFSSPPARRQN